jgi:glycosyltransferase involved in cell wall biosynthesis
VIPWPRLWTHTRFAAALWRARPDVTFVPAHTLPLWFPGTGVVTVHDLGYVYFPESHTRFARRYLDWSTRHSVRRAARIIADSLATARDLAAHYGVPQDRIVLVYPGVDEALAPVSDPALRAAVRARHRLPERYLLFVGTLQPRKNIARIVQGYARWRARQPTPDVALVLAGQRGWLFDPRWIEGVEGVILPGYVDDVDVAALYSGALALVFPTLHEGFGFPVLEAMRCGVPVIGSTTSSLPEVAGDAALLVNPRDVEAIVDAIERIMVDHELRTDLIARGHLQAQRFTWQRTAEQTLQVLEAAAGLSPS